MLAVMRYQGKIVEWNDARGFGFAVPNGGGVRAFVHVGALLPGERRPCLDDAVIYEVQNDAQGRPQAVNVQFVGQQGQTRPAVSRPANRTRRVAREGLRGGWWWRGAVAVVLGMAAVAQWRVHSQPPGEAGNAIPEQPAKRVVRPTPIAEPSSNSYVRSPRGAALPGTNAAAVRAVVSLRRQDPLSANALLRRSNVLPATLP